MQGHRTLPLPRSTAVSEFRNFRAAAGIRFALAFVAVALLAGCSSEEDELQQSSGPVAANGCLVSFFSISPPAPTIAVAQNLQLSADGICFFGDPVDLTAEVTWSSSNPGAATVSPAGLVNGVANGTATITAQFGPLSNSTIVTVGTPPPVTLASIAVTPNPATVPNGSTVQFTATGNFSDSSTSNMTGTVTWSSSNLPVATVNATGLASGLAPGIATITALDVGSGISGTSTLTVTATLVSIAVTPNPSAVNAGFTLQLTATGTLSDASTPDLTATVTWSSSNGTIATVNATGLVTGVAAGTVTITALDVGTGIFGTTTLTVAAPTLVSIAVTPNPSGVNTGSSIQFTATGTFSDASNSNMTGTVTWSSSNPPVATVNATGLASGITGGAVTITALDVGSGIFGTSTLTVNVTFVSEGSIATPLDIGQAIINGAQLYNGQVAGGGNSYYLTPLPAGTWDVSMINMVADADMDLHGSNAFNVGSLITGSANAGTTDEVITLINCPDGPGYCPLYFDIIGFDPGGTSFTLTVVGSGGFTNSEGAPPVPLKLGVAPFPLRTSTIAANSASYYEFDANTVIGGTITISGLGSDLDLFLYATLADLQAGTPVLGSSEQFGTVDETVTYNCGTPPCTFYVEVFEFDGFAGIFNFQVTEP